MNRDKYEVGYFVSTNKFICKNPGQLPTGYVKDSSDRHFKGGTIYNDAASGLICVENQVSIGSNKTVMGNSRFEKWFWGNMRWKIGYPTLTTWMPWVILPEIHITQEQYPPNTNVFLKKKGLLIVEKMYHVFVQ